MSLANVMVGVALNGVVAVGAWWKQSVTIDGAITGWVVGALIFAGAGVSGWLLLMLFFVSSTVLGKLGAARKLGLDRMHEKGSRRDGWQVAANAGIAGVMSLAVAGAQATWAVVGVATALAAANADTWASELGVLSRRPPRSILTLRQVAPGVSGGVSGAGTLASLGGSGLIALASLGLLTVHVGMNPTAVAAALLVMVFGFLGSLVDSLLGATVQAQYVTATGEYTERPELDQTENRRVRGLAAINNDVVNALSGAVATLGSTVVAAAVL